MDAVGVRLVTELRSRWRAWLGLTLLVGLFAGAVTAAAAGARRTDTAYPRFLSWSKAPDLFIFSPSDESITFASLSAHELSTIPEVKQIASGASFSPLYPADVNLVAPATTDIPEAFFHRKMLAGREPRSDRADEVTISFQLAKVHHLGVGDVLHLQLPAPGAGEEPTPIPVALKVVGVDAAVSEFPPQTGTGTDVAWATPAFYKANVDHLTSYPSTVLRLRHGARDVPAAQEALSRLAGGKPLTAFALAEQSANTQRSIHLQAVALWLLAGLLALTAIMVLAQMLMRQTVLESSDFPQLRALGMTRRQLVTMGAGRGAVVGLAGGAVAALVAFLISPLLPVGLARVAEPHPGFAVDATALGIGVLASVVLVTGAATWASWRTAVAVATPEGARPSGRTRPSLVADNVARAAAPASVTAGVRLALETGRGRTAVPVRSTIVGAVVGVAALATALVFGTSLTYLLRTPTLYGVRWDALVTTGATDSVTSAMDAVDSDPRVADLSVGDAGFPLAIGRVRVDGMAVEQRKGRSLGPVAQTGRVPRAPDEIMLGARTMSALHARIGDRVQVSLAGGPPVSYRVVGAGVFPSLSDALGLGTGAAATKQGFARGLAPGIDPPPPQTAFIRFRPGVDKARAIGDLDRLVSATGNTVTVPDKPVDLVNFGRVQSLPVVLAALLGTLAAATLAHLLVTSIRRRRRDLAVLKTLGFSSGQVRSTVSWQATTLAAVAAVVGVPIGIAAGRWVWIVFAHQLGIVPRPAFPILTVAAVGLATVVVANLVAILPGRAAARVRPALVLRSE
jgi:ABC-type lipoprotein release transport system permease subunit